MPNRFARLFSIADARGPRSLIAWMLAVALWSISVTWLVRGLSGNADSPPRPVALDVRLVQLAPPPPPPPPPAPIPRAPAPAAPPKPVHVQLRHVAPPSAPPKIAAVQPPPESHAEPRADLPAPARPEAQTDTGAADVPAKSSAPAGTETATANSESAGNGPAHAILQPVPELPDDLREDALQAVAMARFSIHTDGSVEVELISPTHVPRLNQLLLDTLKKWRFFPAMKNGQPIASSQDIRVHFNVD